MEPIKGKQLDDTYIGLRAKITGDTFTVEGGISDVYRSLHMCQCDDNPFTHLADTTTLFVNGTLVLLGPETDLEVEFTPTQLAAQTGPNTLTEPDTALADAPRAVRGNVGHISGFVISGAVILLVVLLSLVYGLQSTSIIQTMLSIVGIAAAAGLALRMVSVHSRVTRWVA